MKKMIWIVVGLVVVISAVLLIGRERVAFTTEDTEGHGGRATGEIDLATKSTKGTSVNSVSSSEAGGESSISITESDKVLSDPVKALLGLDGKKHNYPSLLSAINDLGDELSADDLMALMEMLNFPNDRFPEKMRSIEINAVKNDVLDKLLRQKHLPEGLGLQMVEMAGNAENDPVWRDYCIQFMTPFYERQSGGLGGSVSVPTKDDTSPDGSLPQSPQDELTAIYDAMFLALDERSETLAGTALIGLELLSRTRDEFDRELIVTKATEIASDEMASPASRMTALRLAAGLTTESTEGSRNTNYDETVDVARALAQTGETVLLRSAAIVTLGEIGTGGDRELLVSYATDENRQIAEAAKLALEKMNQEPLNEPVQTDVASTTTSEPKITEKLPPVLIN